MNLVIYIWGLLNRQSLFDKVLLSYISGVL